MVSSSAWVAVHCSKLLPAGASGEPMKPPTSDSAASVTNAVRIGSPDSCGVAWPRFSPQKIRKQDRAM